MTAITSTSNPQIKQIRKLKERKYRTESGLFFLEGIRIVIEALESSDCIQELIVARELLENSKAVETIEQAEGKGIPVLEVNREVFESISGKDGPQGLAAVGRQKWYFLENIDTDFNGIWIALYQVADPGNLGTILRTLDGMGGKGVFLLDHCTDPYDPSAIRASMGGIFSKKIIKTTSSEFLQWAHKNKTQMVGTSDGAVTHYRSYSYPKDCVLLMGSEREGLTVELMNASDVVVSIPMAGKADSLNLAVASALVLYEISWQVNGRKEVP